MAEAQPEQRAARPVAGRPVERVAAQPVWLAARVVGQPGRLAAQAEGLEGQAAV